MAADDYLLIGKITGAHGLKGDLKFFSHAESLSVFQKGVALKLKNADGEEEICTVIRVKARKKSALLSLKEIKDRNEAEKRAGARVYILRSSLSGPEEDAYYWSDLMGLKVIDTDGGFLGRLVSVMRTGSNDVYVVKNGDKETLVPALEWVVTKIDLKGGIMEVDLPEGL